MLSSHKLPLEYRHGFHALTGIGIHTLTMQFDRCCLFLAIFNVKYILGLFFVCRQERWICRCDSCLGYLGLILHQNLFQTACNSMK